MGNDVVRENVTYRCWLKRPRDRRSYAPRMDDARCRWRFPLAFPSTLVDTEGSYSPVLRSMVPRVMDLRALGRSGLLIHPMVFGCAGLGVRTREEHRDAIRAAWEAGVVAFDTAEIYGTEGLLADA